MHPLNPYRDKKPDFASLAKLHPSFAPYVTVSDTGYASIDFQDAAALRALTSVLLKEDWGYDVELREDRLCPTIANRLDYLYHVLDIEPYLSPLPDLSAETSATSTSATAPKRPLKVLDIGTGHIAIYPLLLHNLRPTTQIVATELDAVSFHHAVKTRLENNIPASSLSIRRPTADQPILFPIFDDIAERRASIPTANSAEVQSQGEGSSQAWDFVICNPPFFGSEEEIRLGKEGKASGAHAAPTAANNELITPGGEVEFVGQMIKESLELKEACLWYTSLIGKYSSLASLVDQLRSLKIDNYFIKILRQSRTTRWILGWSHTSLRLPDVRSASHSLKSQVKAYKLIYQSITRPVDFIPGTSFAKLLPPPNTFSHTPSDPPIPAPELRTRVENVLREVQLLPPRPTSGAGPSSAPCLSPVANCPLSIAPPANTWSRAARRQAARGAPVANGASEDAVLFRAEFHFIGVENPAPVAAQVTEEGTVVEGGANSPAAEAAEPAPKPTARAGGRVELRWTEGGDRTLVEGLWKYILTKASLIHGR